MHIPVAILIVALLGIAGTAGLAGFLIGQRRYREQVRHELLRYIQGVEDLVGKNLTAIRREHATQRQSIDEIRDYQTKLGKTVSLFLEQHVRTLDTPNTVDTKDAEGTEPPKLDPVHIDNSRPGPDPADVLDTT